VVSIVLLQNVRDGNALCGKRSTAFPIAVAARRVRGAVRSVGAEGEHGSVPETGDFLCGGKGDLLIAPAKAGAGQMDDRLAARYEGQRLFAGLVILGDGRKEAARVPGGTPQAVRQHHGRVAEAPRRTAGAHCR